MLLTDHNNYADMPFQGLQDHESHHQAQAVQPFADSPWPCDDSFVQPKLFHSPHHQALPNPTYHHHHLPSPPPAYHHHPAYHPEPHYATMSFGSPPKNWMGPLSLKAPPLPSTFNPSGAYGNTASQPAANVIEASASGAFGALTAGGLLQSATTPGSQYRVTSSWASPNNASSQSTPHSWLHSPPSIGSGSIGKYDPMASSPSGAVTPFGTTAHVPSALQSFVSPRGTTIVNGMNGQTNGPPNNGFWSPPQTSIAQSNTMQSVLDLPPVPVSSSAAQVSGVWFLGFFGRKEG